MTGGYVFLGPFRHLFYFDIVVTCSPVGAGTSTNVLDLVDLDPVSVLTNFQCFASISLLQAVFIFLVLIFNCTITKVNCEKL